MEKIKMKYFKEKLTLSSSIRDDSAQNLDEKQEIQKHLEDYRKTDKIGKLFSAVPGTKQINKKK